MEEGGDGMEMTRAAMETTQDGSSMVPVDWASLPQDLLLLVYARLSLSDAVRSSAVCRRWRLVRRPHHPVLWRQGSSELLSVADGRVFSLDLPPDLLLMRHRLIYTGCYRDWLSAIVPGERHWADGGWKHSLYNPFTRDRFELPTLTLNSRPKVVLSSSPELPCCTAACLHHFIIGVGSGLVGFWRLGGDQRDWVMLPLEEEKAAYRDVIFYKRSLYVVNGLGELKLVELTDHHPFHRVATLLPRPPTNYRKLEYERGGRDRYFLVECGDDLLILCCLLYSGCMFHLMAVFRANLHLRQWEEVQSLGGRAIFVAQTFCGSIWPVESVGIAKDCVYIHERGSSLEIFNVAKKKQVVGAEASPAFTAKPDGWQESPLEYFNFFLTPNPWWNQGM